MNSKDATGAGTTTLSKTIDGERCTLTLDVTTRERWWRVKGRETDSLHDHITAAVRAFDALGGDLFVGTIDGVRFPEQPGFSSAAEPSVIGLDAMLPKAPDPREFRLLTPAGEVVVYKHATCAPRHVVIGGAFISATLGKLALCDVEREAVKAFEDQLQFVPDVGVHPSDFATLRAEAEGHKAGDVRQKFEQGVHASIERMHQAIDRQDAQDLTFKDLRPGDTISGLRVVAVDLKDARDFGAALDKTLPPSMSPRPGERCKVCGEAVPMTARDPVRMRETGGPEFHGWGRLVFPMPESDSLRNVEWLNLCPKDAKRVAEYIAYCAAHPHARDGE